ncbi:hypothetical protein BGLA2_270055 [Burkholderia gladioli]|nr:hypothetical protein BGLA2_270055 [Burkholderia gladioli]
MPRHPADHPRRGGLAAGARHRLPAPGRGRLGRCPAIHRKLPPRDSRALRAADHRGGQVRPRARQLGAGERLCRFHRVRSQVRRQSGPAATARRRPAAGRFRRGHAVRRRRARLQRLPGAGPLSGAWLSNHEARISRAMNKDGGQDENSIDTSKYGVGSRGPGGDGDLRVAGHRRTERRRSTGAAEAVDRRP